MMLVALGLMAPQITVDTRGNIVAIEAAVTRREARSIIQQIERICQQLFGRLWSLVAHRSQMTAAVSIVNRADDDMMNLALRLQERAGV